MGSYLELSQEIMSGIGTDPTYADTFRRKKIAELSDITGRDVIVYATDFLNPGKGNAGVGIDLTDKEGFVDIIKNLNGDKLDVVIQSPGGFAEAAESIVEILREKYKEVRFIIPNVAKSAATIMAMSGDELLMDERSELGPTDPQISLNRDGDNLVAPAHAVKAQFEKAQQDIAEDPAKLSPWIPILRQYGPALLSQCDMSIDLSEALVKKWLVKYMLRGDADKEKKATKIAKYLNSSAHLTHGRRIGITELEDVGVKIFDLRNDEKLRTAVWDLYLTYKITFDNTPAYKIFENHNGDALIRQIQIFPMPQQSQP